jgi:hypothetical protein
MGSAGQLRHPTGSERPTLTRHAGGTALHNYEIHSATGGVLQGCDKLEPLLKHLDQKVGAVVVRTVDGTVVARGPELNS